MKKECPNTGELIEMPCTNTNCEKYINEEDYRSQNRKGTVDWTDIKIKKINRKCNVEPIETWISCMFEYQNKVSIIKLDWWDRSFTQDLPPGPGRTFLWRFDNIKQHIAELLLKGKI